MARKTGFSENFIRDSEHQRPTNSFLYDLYTAVQTPSVPDQVFIAQAKVIKEAASRESCVIVGRCADYILRGDPRRLSVFVHAPLDERVRRAREEYGSRSPTWRPMCSARTGPAPPTTTTLPPGRRRRRR